jgi:hypothetical protein
MGLEGDRFIGKSYIGWNRSGRFSAWLRQELAHENGQPDGSKCRHDENPAYDRDHLHLPVFDVT